MSINLLLNIAFTLLWLLLTQNTSFLNAGLGFILGAIVVALGARAAGKPPHMARLVNLGRFLVYFLYIMVKANLEVAWEVLTPGHTMTPRMIRYNIKGLSAVQVTTLANAISLTPGTLSTDIDDNSEWLYIHAMYADKREDAIAGLDQLRKKLFKLVFDCDPAGQPLQHK